MGRVDLNSGVVNRVARDARQEVLENAVRRVEANAKTEAPVDTGRLRNSIRAEDPEPAFRYVDVVSKAPYSVWVHEGTRHQSPNAYLARAIQIAASGR